MRIVHTTILAGLMIAAAQHGNAEPGRAAVRPVPLAPAPVATPVQTPPAPAATPAQTPPTPDPVPATPQQTTASFGDWTLRCSRAGAAAPLCEIVQTITSQDRTLAQLAVGRIAKAQPLHLTILVPASVSMAPAPTLALHEGDAAVLELAWRRCLPVGCLAEALLPDDLLARMRAVTEAGRITFTDGAGRLATLPFSPRGLAQALDALGKEDAG